jgi:ABC-2 type transport system ATP-binding protein
MNPAVELSGVTRRFPHFTLQDVSLRVEPGEIMGFVGPNGAGKSTTLRLLMGLLRADAGRIEVLGCRMPEQQVRAKQEIGFLAEDMGLFGAATVDWHLRFLRSIHPRWDEPHARSLLRRFQLRPAQAAKSLSHGERIKLLLILCLARRPRLLVLDEPTTGLDPVARHEVLAELVELLREGDGAVVFSSHNTLDVEQISDRITFLDRGRVVAADDRESFLERWRRVDLELASDAPLPMLEGVVRSERGERVARLTLERWDDSVPARLAAAGARVHEVHRMTLEEIFVASVLQHRREDAP